MVANYNLVGQTIFIKSQLNFSKKDSTNHSAKLGWILVQKKAISQTELESTLIIQFRHEKRLGELLVEQQLISREELEEALKEQYWRRNGYWII